MNAPVIDFPTCRFLFDARCSHRTVAGSKVSHFRLPFPPIQRCDWQDIRHPQTHSDTRMSTLRPLHHPRERRPISAIWSLLPSANGVCSLYGLCAPSIWLYRFNYFITLIVQVCSAQSQQCHTVLGPGFVCWGEKRRDRTYRRVQPLWLCLELAARSSRWWRVRSVLLQSEVAQSTRELQPALLFPSNYPPFDTPIHWRFNRTGRWSRINLCFWRHCANTFRCHSWILFNVIAWILNDIALILLNVNA